MAFYKQLSYKEVVFIQFFDFYFDLKLKKMFNLKNYWQYLEQKQEQEFAYFSKEEEFYQYTPYSIPAEFVLRDVCHIFCTMLPILGFYALARLITQANRSTLKVRSVQRFGLELLIVVLPTVLCFNVLNWAVELLCGIMALSLFAIFAYGHCWRKARTHVYHTGRRMQTLTMLRSFVFLLTGLNILAVDFPQYPLKFRKCRKYGAALMDLGIGFFIAMMGSVLRMPSKTMDYVREILMVVVLFVLGLLRVLLLQLFNYQQNVHEYGAHLNAFFMLGFVKLLGYSLISCVRKPNLLLPLSILLLLAHETALQCGLSDYAMSEFNKRDTLLNANREGLCAIPGFVALYLHIAFLNLTLKTDRLLLFAECFRKMMLLVLLCIFYWIGTVACIYSIGIARVTCNLGYVLWVCANAVTLMTISLFVFDFVLNTGYPLRNTAQTIKATSMLICHKLNEANIPSMAHALNLNGLLFFMLSNATTGILNMLLNVRYLTALQEVAILSLYMTLNLMVIFMLFRYNIRIV